MASSANLLCVGGTVADANRRRRRRRSFHHLDVMREGRALLVVATLLAAVHESEIEWMRVEGTS